MLKLLALGGIALVMAGCIDDPTFVLSDSETTEIESTSAEADAGAPKDAPPKPTKPPRKERSDEDDDD